MSVLIADSGRGRLLGCDRMGLRFPIPCRAQRPCLPMAAGRLLLVGCPYQQEVYCLSRSDLSERLTMPAPPGLSALCPSPCCRYLYQLGGDCDCVHMRSLASGDMMRSCPVGVYPRDMKLDPTGRYLLIAGGASGELILLDAQELKPLIAKQLSGAVCAACFAGGGFAALVTRENGDMETSLVSVSRSGREAETLAMFSGLAGGLIALGGDAVILGVQDGVKRFSLPTRTLTTLSRSLPLPARLQLGRGRLLVSGTLLGQVAQLSLTPPFLQETLYQGEEVEAAYV